jgi:hypothetical protein
MLWADPPPEAPLPVPVSSVLVAPVPVVPVDVRFTAETARVDQGVRMGMAGMHLLRPIGEHGFGGVSVFGATQGDRGGFFGWGITGGARWRSGAWQAEAGLFAGGGGGSPGWVGGGWMLRPHAALALDIGPLTLGLGVAHLRFPSGSVRSTQPYASLGWTGQGLFGPAEGGAATEPARWSNQAVPSETAATFGRYSFGQRSVRRDGSFNGRGAAESQPLQHGGLVFRRDLSGALGGAQPYCLLSAAGGLTAAYAGYAELLGGAGLRWSPAAAPRLALRAEAAVGSGGAGAAADTGGGLLGKLLAGASWEIAPGLALSAMAGRTGSRGPFAARELRLELGWRGWDVLPGEQRSASEEAPGALEWVPWTFSSGVIHQSRMARDDGSRQALSLTTLRLERALDSHWRLTGQAAIAIAGQAGGYATGQLGLAWLTAPQAGSPWRVGAGASLGAAGGGGVRVGGGWVGEAQMLARYAVSPSWALQADAGWLRGGSGVLNSPQWGLSVVYSFSRLQGRR